jgi:hypothetical protein
MANTLINAQLKVDETRLKEQQRDDNVKEILRKLKEKIAEEAEQDKEDARLAREKGWCDDSLSDKTAAAIYRDKTCPWRMKPNRSPTGN